MASGGLRDLIPTIARTGGWLAGCGWCYICAGAGAGAGTAAELLLVLVLRCWLLGLIAPVLTCNPTSNLLSCITPNVHTSPTPFHSYHPPSLSPAAVACGVDGVFMEVHDDPTASPVDAPTQWPLRWVLRGRGWWVLRGRQAGR